MLRPRGTATTGDGGIMELLGVVERVKSTANKIPNEESTKQHLILPILMALGWNVFSPNEVMPEAHTEEGRPDYALMPLY